MRHAILSLLLHSSLFVSISQSAPVPVMNAGFESGLFTDWSDQNDPAKRRVEALPGFAAEGTYHVSVDAGWAVWQDVPGCFYRPWTIYSLRAAAGNRLGFTTPGNICRIQLTAPGETGTAGAVDVAAGTAVPPGQWAEGNVRYATGAASIRDMKPVRILLGSPGTGRSHFDSIRLASVGTFGGGDAGEGLDLNGDFSHAFMLGSSAPAPVTVSGVVFQNNDTSHANLLVEPAAAARAGNWSAPDYGITANDNALETVMRGIRWTGRNNTLRLTLRNVTPGVPHKLQLLFVEQGFDRSFDVRVDGVLIFDDFRPQEFDATGTVGGVQAGLPLVISHRFVSRSSTVVVDLDGMGSTQGSEQNPTISAVTLERIGSELIDFSGPGRPLGSQLYGQATVGTFAGQTGSSLSLGEMISVDQTTLDVPGSFVVPAPGDEVVHSMDFRVRHTATGASPAGGVSLCWGDVPAAPFDERGPEGFRGLRVSVTLGVLPNLSLHWQGNPIAVQPLTGSFQNQQLHVRVRPGGKVEAVYGTNYPGLQVTLPGFAGLRGRWGMGGRTGGASSQYVDDVALSDLPHIAASAADIVFHTARIGAQPGAIGQIHMAPVLNGATLEMPQSLVLTNHALTLDASMLPNGLILSGRNAVRLVECPSGTATALLDRLGLWNGFSGSDGGGIQWNGAFLRMVDCEVSGCVATDGGGGIRAAGALAMQGCAITECQGDLGAGLLLEGQGWLENTTVCRNPGQGGIATYAQASLVMSHCTVTENQAPSDAPLNGGVVLWFGTQATLRNCIVAGNLSGSNPVPDIFDAGTLTQQGVNWLGIAPAFSGDPASQPGLPNSAGHYVGSLAAPADPRLKPLSWYGGFARSLHPQRHSPVMDKSAPALPADQRGVGRTSLSDIGSVDTSQEMILASTAEGGPGSLREMLLSAQPGSRICTAPELRGATITLNGPLVRNSPVLLEAEGLTLDGQHNSALLTVQDGGHVTAEGLTFTRSPVAVDCVAGGNFTARDCSLVRNVIALRSAGGRVSLDQCTVAENETPGASSGLLFAGHATIAANSNMLTANAAMIRSSIVPPVLQASLIYQTHSVVSSAARLAPLGWWGGNTETMPPRPGSPAQDIAPAQSGTDQRGEPRNLWGTDAGAVEAGPHASGAWEVKAAGSAAPLNSLTAVESFLPTIAAGDWRYGSSTEIQFGPRHPFIGGDTDHFVTEARAVIEVPQAGTYTLAFRCRGGAILDVAGQTFSWAGIEGAEAPADGLVSGSVLKYRGLSAGLINVLGQCVLPAGKQPVRFLTWAGAGPAEAAVFYAAGAKTLLDAEFRPLGSTRPAEADMGMLTPVTPGGDVWRLTAVPDSASSLTEAVNVVFNSWPGFPAVNTWHLHAAALDFGSAGTLANGQPPVPLPVFINPARLAFGAQATLAVTHAGSYTFCMAARDAARFRIKGSRGWKTAGALALVDGFTAANTDSAFGNVWLPAGDHELEIVFQNQDSSYRLGLWMAAGEHTAWSPVEFVLPSTRSRTVAAPLALVRSPRPGNDLPELPYELPPDGAQGATAFDGATATAAEMLPGGISRSVSWRWTAPASGEAFVDTTGSDFTPFVKMGPAGGPGGIGFSAVIGQSYDFNFAAASAEHGRLQFRLRYQEPPPPPANDAPQLATILDPNHPLACVDTTSATASANEPRHTPDGSEPAYHTVWFRWIAPRTGHWIVDTAGSRFETTVAVYTRSPGLTRVAADFGSVGVEAVAGTQYWIALDGRENQSGMAFLSLLHVPDVTPALAAGQMRLHWQSEAGTSWRVEHSADLHSWTPAGPSVNSRGGVTEWTWPSTSQRLFFRLRPW